MSLAKSDSERTIIGSTLSQFDKDLVVSLRTLEPAIIKFPARQFKRQPNKNNENERVLKVRKQGINLKDLVGVAITHGSDAVDQHPHPVGINALMCRVTLLNISDPVVRRKIDFQEFTPNTIIMREPDEIGSYMVSTNGSLTFLRMGKSYPEFNCRVGGEPVHVDMVVFVRTTDRNTLARFEERLYDFGKKRCVVLPRERPSQTVFFHEIEDFVVQYKYGGRHGERVILDANNIVKIDKGYQVSNNISKISLDIKEETFVCFDDNGDTDPRPLKRTTLWNMDGTRASIGHRLGLDIDQPGAEDINKKLLLQKQLRAQPIQGKRLSLEQLQQAQVPTPAEDVYLQTLSPVQPSCEPEPKKMKSDEQQQQQSSQNSVPKANTVMSAVVLARSSSQEELEAIARKINQSSSTSASSGLLQEGQGFLWQNDSWDSKDSFDEGGALLQKSNIGFNVKRNNNNSNNNQQNVFPIRNVSFEPLFIVEEEEEEKVEEEKAPENESEKNTDNSNEITQPPGLEPFNFFDISQSLLKPGGEEPVLQQQQQKQERPMPEHHQQENSSDDSPMPSTQQLIQSVLHSQPTLDFLADKPHVKRKANGSSKGHLKRSGAQLNEKDDLPADEDLSLNAFLKMAGNRKKLLVFEAKTSQEDLKMLFKNLDLSAIDAIVFVNSHANLYHPVAKIVHRYKFIHTAMCFYFANPLKSKLTGVFVITREKTDALYGSHHEIFSDFWELLSGSMGTTKKNLAVASPKPELITQSVCFNDVGDDYAISRQLVINTPPAAPTVVS